MGRESGAGKAPGRFRHAGRGLASLLLLAGCASTPRPAPAAVRPAAPPPSLSPWQRIAWFTDRLAANPGEGEDARLAHELALAYLAVDRPPRAREYFRRSQYRDREGVLRAANDRGIGESYLREGIASMAEKPLSSAAATLPRGRWRDEALLLLALCLARLDRTEEAAAARARIADAARGSLAALERSLAPTPAPRATARPPSPAPSPAAALVPRRTWGPAPMGRQTEPMGLLTRITIHHSGLPFTSSSPAATALEIRKIQRAHQEREGWADIGYHFVIDRSGKVWEARPLAVQGAHAGNGVANRGNIGICLLGDFEFQSPTAEQAGSLARLLREFMARDGIPAGRIYTHREIRALYRLGSTACPGRNLEPLVERLRSRDLRGAPARLRPSV